MTPLPEELTQRLLAFRTERDWEQFHNARSLATALSVEASELLEHFIWAKDADVAEIVDKRRDEIEAELADVGMLLAYLCHDLGVDLAAAVSRKRDANALKYPNGKVARAIREVHAAVTVPENAMANSRAAAVSAPQGNSAN